jgi:hypothetical protein
MGSRWFVVAAMMALALPACSSDPPRSGSVEPGAIRITEGRTSAALTTALLTIQDFPRAGLLGLTEVDLEEGPLYENPDPRGPCGATSASRLKFQDAAIAFFQSPSGVSVLHALWNLPPGQAAAVLAEARADMRPGCPPFESDTPFGGPQVNEFLGAIDLPSIGEDRLALSHRIEGPAGGTVYGTVALIRIETWLASLAIFSPEEVDDRVVSRLADAVGRKLGALPGS